MKKGIAAFLAAFLLGCAAAFSAWQLIAQHLQEAGQQKALEELAGQAAPAAGGGQPSYEELFARYPDMAGWISIEGTGIDYPVMHTPERPNYYLRRAADGSYSTYGVPYLQEACELDGSDNLVVYGHCMKNGSMFAPLLNYESEEYCGEHREITLTTREETRRYEVVCAFKVDMEAPEAFRYWEFINAADEAEYAEYLQKAKALAFYDTGVDPAWGRQLLTLSTCEYTQKDGRFVVLAARTE